MNPSESYRPVTESVVAELREICGSKNVLFGQQEAMEAYSHDEVADGGYAVMPEAVVKPASAREISTIMRLADRERIPVTPRGAGSGLSCGAVPLYGGIVLSVERMNRIVEIDVRNMTITVEAGVVTNHINEVLEEYGLFYAGYPMSLETCFIGGNVAENAGGGKAVKYGVTGRYVQGLEAVLPDGAIVRIGGKRVKDVTGYNLLGLLVGSEGTLAVFTEVTLKLTALPKHKVTLLVLFPTVDEAIDAVPALMTETGVVPTAIEFMDRLSVQTACRYLNEHFPYEEAGAMLIIEIDGSGEEEVEAQYDAVGQVCLDRGALEVYVADNFTTSERVWRVRRNIAEAFKVSNPVQSLEDIVVPFAQIPQLIRVIEDLSRRHGLLIPSYGHAGDGNLHATPVKPAGMSLEEWESLLPRLLRELYAATAELGGTISGEHGIGSKRKAYMPLVLSPELLSLMKRVKDAFDPHHILNPGKIFP